MTQTLGSQHYTLSDYFALEVVGDQRYEYWQGIVVPMTGGTPDHNQVLLNIATRLNFCLRGQPYRVFAADQRLCIPEKEVYAYPDVCVVKGVIELQAGRKDTIMNPIMIVEVLSESTRAYDKDAKFVAYRTIPCFAEYLLVEQDRCCVEHYRKTGTREWQFTEFSDLAETLELTTVPCSLPLVEIYEKVLS